MNRKTDQQNRVRWHVSLYNEHRQYQIAPSLAERYCFPAQGEGSPPVLASAQLRPGQGDALPNNLTGGTPDAMSRSR